MALLFDLNGMVSKKETPKTILTTHHFVPPCPYEVPFPALAPPHDAEPDKLIGRGAFGVVW